jgi:hypothetical protein
VVANTPGLVVYLERSRSRVLSPCVPPSSGAPPPSPPCYIHLYISLSLFANHPLTLVVFALVVQGMLSDTACLRDDSDGEVDARSLIGDSEAAGHWQRTHKRRYAQNCTLCPKGNRAPGPASPVHPAHWHW